MHCIINVESEDIYNNVDVAMHEFSHLDHWPLWIHTSSLNYEFIVKLWIHIWISNYEFMAYEFIYENFSEFMAYEFIYENVIEFLYEFRKYEFTYAFIYESATMNS